MSGSFILAAGGTGGHLYPAEALGRELLRRGFGVAFLTDSRSAHFAERILGAVIHPLPARKLGGGPATLARGVLSLASSTLEARRLLRRNAPQAVVGFGGYPSLAAMLAAFSMGLPTVIHEQNAVLGRANRLLASRASSIAIAFPETRGLKLKHRLRAVHTGNPVRPAILALGEKDYAPPAAAGPIELLILGGSQGARILSEIVPPALARLPEEMRAVLRVSHQARPEDRAGVMEAYRKSGIAAEVESFFTDVPARLARTYLVICRAGASTIAELAASGRPAVLVPYPYATDDHQSANARAFAEAGGGWVLAQSEFDPERLSALVLTRLADPRGLKEAALSSRRFGRRDAALRLAELVLECAGARERGRAA